MVFSRSLVALAIAVVFTATNPFQSGGGVMNAGAEEIEVTVLDPGPTCARGQLASGEVVSLAGVPKQTPPKTVLQMVGEWVRYSNCMQGRTFKAARSDPQPD